MDSITCPSGRITTPTHHDQFEETPNYPGNRLANIISNNMNRLGPADLGKSFLMTLDTDQVERIMIDEEPVKTAMLSDYKTPSKKDRELIRRHQQQNGRDPRQRSPDPPYREDHPSEQWSSKKDHARFIQFSSFNLSGMAQTPQALDRFWMGSHTVPHQTFTTAQGSIPDRLNIVQTEDQRERGYEPITSGPLHYYTQSQSSRTAPHVDPGQASYQNQPPEDTYGRSGRFDDPRLQQQLGMNSATPPEMQEPMVVQSADHLDRWPTTTGMDQPLSSEDIRLDEMNDLQQRSLSQAIRSTVIDQSNETHYGSGYLDQPGNLPPDSIGSQNIPIVHTNHLLNQQYQGSIFIQSEAAQPGSGMHPASDHPFYGQKPCYMEGGQVPEGGYASVPNHQKLQQYGAYHGSKNQNIDRSPQEDVIEDGQFMMNNVYTPPGQLVIDRLEHDQGSWGPQGFEYGHQDPETADQTTIVGSSPVEHGFFASQDGSISYHNDQMDWDQDVYEPFQTMDTANEGIAPEVYMPIYSQVGSPPSLGATLASNSEQLSPGSTSSENSGRLPTYLKANSAPTHASAIDNQIEPIDIHMEFQRAQEELRDENSPDNNGHLPLKPIDFELPPEAGNFENDYGNSYAKYVKNLNPWLPLEDIPFLEDSRSPSADSWSLGNNEEATPSPPRDLPRVKPRRNRENPRIKKTLEQKKERKRIQNRKDSTNCRDKKKSEREKAAKEKEHIQSLIRETQKKVTEIENHVEFIRNLLDLLQISEPSDYLNSEKESYMAWKVEICQKSLFAQGRDEDVVKALEKWQVEIEKFEKASKDYEKTTDKKLRQTIGSRKTRARQDGELCKNHYDILVGKHDLRRETHLLRLAENHFKKAAELLYQIDFQAVRPLIHNNENHLKLDKFREYLRANGYHVPF